MSFFNRCVFVIREGFHQMVRAKGLSTAVIVIVAATLLQLSVFLGISKALDNILGTAREKFELAIFMTPDADPSDRKRVQAVLEADPWVATVKVVTRDEALQEFRKDPQIDQMVQALGENPLTDSISAVLKKDAAGKLDDLIAALRKDPKVEEVNYGKAEWETVLNLTRIVRWTGFFLGGFIFLTALFIVTNTLSLALWARREDLILLSRMGAPGWMRLGPYLWEGVLQGLFGSAAAVLFLEVARHGLIAALQKVGGIDAFLKLPDDQWMGLFLILVLLGVVLGALGAFLALQKKWVKELQ